MTFVLSVEEDGPAYMAGLRPGQPLFNSKVSYHVVSFESVDKAPSTRIRFRLKTQLFLFGLAFRPHVSGENGDRKRKSSKTLSSVEIFGNAVFVFSCGMRKRNFSQTRTSQFLDPAYPAPKPREKFYLNVKWRRLLRYKKIQNIAALCLA